MYEFHPYFTNDGSVGLYNTEFDDIYHSACGALTEAYEKFIYPIDFEKLLEKESVKILTFIILILPLPFSLIITKTVKNTIYNKIFK